jgi:hypothetical protein
MLIGLVYLFYMRSKNPERIQDTAKVFLMEESGELAGEGAVAPAPAA